MIDEAWKNMQCPYNCSFQFGKHMNGKWVDKNQACRNFLENYYMLYDGMYSPIIVILIVFVIILGRILKTFLKKKMVIKDYDYEELEKVLNSPEKINLFIQKI